MAVDERSEVIFFDPSRDVATATNFLLTVSTQFFVTLHLLNGMR